MDVQLPDGTVVQGVPEGTTRDQLAQKLQAKGLPVPKEWLNSKPGIDSIERSPVSRGLEETALHVGSGLVASAAGGVAGIARGAGAGAASLARGEGAGRALDAFSEEATQTIGRVGEALTYQPKTTLGKAGTQALEYPFRKLAQGADWVGEHTASATERALRAAGLDDATAKRAAAAAGAAVNTAIQSAPGVIGGRALSRTRAAETPPELSTQPVSPRTPPSSVGESPEPSGGVPRGTSAPELSTVPGAPRTPPSTVGEGALPSSPPTAARVGPEAAARTYARSIGLDWNTLGAGTRQALTTIAQDSTALTRLDPAAVRREAALQQLRVPVQATRGQLARDPVQLRREAIASNTSEGQPIRDADIAANRDLQANLEVLRGRVGGRRGTLEEPVTPEGEANPGSIRGATKTATQVGEAAQTAIRQKAKWSKKGYEALYKVAEKTEPDAPAALKPVTDLLNENPDIQHVGWVQSWLSKARAAKARAQGVAPDVVDLSQVTLKELYDLRKLATKNMAKGSTTAHYAAQVREAVDTAMREVPEGTAAWKRATDAFRTHQQEFKDQGLVNRLANQKKGGADRQLALEKTWKQVAMGPLEQIRQVKKTLLTGGTAELRAAGRKAWRDMRAETVNRILEDARNVTVADETERAVLTEAALRRSINRIPRENLEELIGKANTRELFQILRARRITTRSPIGGRTTQSGTVPNALVLFEKVLKHIPGGKYVVGAKNLLKEAGERGELQRAAQEATVSPLEQAARDVERSRTSLARRRAYQAIEGTGPTISPAAPEPTPTIGDVVKRPPP